MLTVATKSKALLSLIQNIPGFMTKKAVKELAVNPKNTVLGFEDASTAIASIELSEDDKKRIDDKEKSTKLDDLFPNPRLTAEMEIIKDTDRTLYNDFKNKMIELDSIAKEIDQAAGPSLDFLLDEVSQQVDKSILDSVKNMGVSIINVQDGKIVNK